VLEENLDIILLEILLTDINGIEVLKRIIDIPDSPPVIILSKAADLSVIREAFINGAVDYICKPFNLEFLKTIIKRTFINFRACKCFKDLLSPELSNFIGETSVIKRIKRLICIYAGSEASVLITGESGTGKDLVARAVHGISSRRNRPYITKNCAAIPDSIFETELFGSEKGAFTDAVSRAGSFEQANKGTLLLDEIGEMAISSQVKLLRILEEKDLVRLGGVNRIPIDVRIISATNKDILNAVRKGEFRQDLYYRINTLPIKIPSLKERKKDLPLLINHILKKTGKNMRISISAVEKLKAYSWPGNVRELKNVLERAVCFAENNIIEIRNIILS